MGLFRLYVEVTVRDGDRLDLKEMIRRTSEEMAKQTPVIWKRSREICKQQKTKKRSARWDEIIPSGALLYPQKESKGGNHN